MFFFLVYLFIYFVEKTMFFLNPDRRRPHNQQRVFPATSRLCQGRGHAYSHEALRRAVREQEEAAGQGGEEEVSH